MWFKYLITNMYNVYYANKQTSKFISGADIRRHGCLLYFFLLLAKGLLGAHLGTSLVSLKGLLETGV